MTYHLFVGPSSQITAAKSSGPFILLVEPIMKLGTILDRVVDTMAVIAGVILVLITSGVAFGIVSRYFFGRPIGWIVEISEYSLLFIAFLVAAWVLKHDGHVKMDMVVDRLRSKDQDLLNGITAIISAVVCLILTYYSARVTIELYQIGYYTPTTLEVPKFIIVAIIVIGSFVLSLQLIRRAIFCLRNWKMR